MCAHAHQSVELVIEAVLGGLNVCHAAIIH
jgi:HEPN domain-containing protein